MTKDQQDMIWQDVHSAKLQWHKEKGQLSDSGCGVYLHRIVTPDDDDYLEYHFEMRFDGRSIRKSIQFFHVMGIDKGYLLTQFLDNMREEFDEQK